MNYNQVLESISARVADMRLFDFHTHLVGGKLGARGLHDILLYHMSISELYSAGCPSGARLSQYPNWPDQEEAHFRLKEAIPFLPKTRNTGISWGIRTILSDLYDWTEPVTRHNWEELDEIIRERANDNSWARSVLNAANIERAVTETNRREGGVDDDILDYSIEWAFFTRTQWGEYDTALYELERVWGEEPNGPTPIGLANRPEPKKVIRNGDDVREAVAWFVGHFPRHQTYSYATHFSTDLDYRLVSEEEFQAALERRDRAGEQERNVYASFVNERFLEEYGRKLGQEVGFQFSVCAEPLPFETGSRISQKTLRQLGEMIARHPEIRFTAMESSAHANQTFCTFVRELPNFALAGIWWHNFFPAFMPQLIRERLDMLPLNRQIGFFSDAYCVEWAYAKAKMVKNALSRVLAEKVELGQYTVESALSIGQELLYEGPRAWNLSTHHEVG
ncbi:MAG: hypothetical protein ACRC10_08065 [Thermoguttaceae bacterium]